MRKEVIWITVSLIMAILLIVSVLRSSNNSKENELYKNKIENDYKIKLKQYELELERSRRERMVLIDSFNDRSIYIETLVRSLDQQKEELKAIKGKYKKLTSSEKANELIRRANDTK
jgi:hypothetical protein